MSLDTRQILIGLILNGSNEQGVGLGYHEVDGFQSWQSSFSMDNLELYVQTLAKERSFNMLNAAFMNMRGSFPVAENVPSFTIPIPMVGEGAHDLNFMSNSRIESNSPPFYFRQSLVSSSASSFGFKLNGAFPVETQPLSVLIGNEQFNVLNSESTLSFGSFGSTPFGIDPTQILPSVMSSMLEPNIHVPKRIQPTHLPTLPNPSWLCYDSIMRKLAYNPLVGCRSFVGSSDSFSVTSQQISFSNFASPSVVDSHSYLNSRDQPHLSFAMPTMPDSFLNDFGSSMEVPQCLMSNSRIGQVSSTILATNDSTYNICGEWDGNFSNSQSLGGHVKTQAKGRKRKKMETVTNEKSASDKESIMTPLAFRPRWRASSNASILTSSSPNASILTSASTYQGGNGSNYENQTKNGFSGSSVEGIGLEKCSSSDETVTKSPIYQASNK